MTIPVEYLNQIVTGDAKVLAERIPDASVDLIFTDPVYENIDDYRWLAETAARVLKPDSACLVSYATQTLPETICAMSTALRFRWQFIEYRSNEVKIRPAPGGRTLYTGLLWFDRGKFRPKFTFDVRSISVSSPPNSAPHKWHKPRSTLLYFLSRFTQDGTTVYDPFTGSGSVPAVCKMLNRNYIAFEIDPDTASRARARVEATQAMHPVFLEEQTMMQVAV